MNTGYSTIEELNTNRAGFKSMMTVVMLLSGVVLPAHADGTAQCNAGAGTGSTECGVNSGTTGNFSTAIGNDAKASAVGATAVGENVDALGLRSVAVGATADAQSDDSVAIGHDANIENTSSPAAIAIGRKSTISANSSWSIAIGGDSDDAGSLGAVASMERAIAIGADAVASGKNSIAVGASASAPGFSSSALGRNAIAEGSNSTALGESASTSGDFPTAVGNSASAHSEGAVSLGNSAGYNNGVPVTNSPHAIAIGRNSNIAAAAPGAIAIGGDVNEDNKGAEVTALDAIAIGADAKATARGAIAIGADVVADIKNTLVTNVPILAKDPSTTVAPRTMFEIAGAGNTKFNVNNTDANESWAFANPGTGFRLSRQGSGVVEFEVKNNGNAVLAGTLTENSDINNKHDIQWLNQEEILDKVMSLPIAQWRYNDAPDSKHIGPMAQDFYRAFELGDTDKGISSIDTGGVALAAIQALKKENQQIKLEKDTQKSPQLKNQISELSVLVEELLERS